MTYRGNHNLLIEFSPKEEVVLDKDFIKKKRFLGPYTKLKQ